MSPLADKPRVTLDQVRRLWFARQGLSKPRARPLTRRRFLDLLGSAGGLQLDSVNVLERAHLLTLWSRFGPFDRDRLHSWIYRDRLAYEYWGHVASILPADRLPLSRRGMKRFNPTGSWWEERWPKPASFRHVRGRLREEGPLESADFEADKDQTGPWWGWKESKRALEILWMRGEIAVSSRRHFRRIYDLAERVYPPGPAAPLSEYQDSWLFTGLRGNGVASRQHLNNYFTAPRLKAAEQGQVIARNLKKGCIVEVEVEGLDGPFYALPEDLEGLGRHRRPGGTTLIGPFDSLLWQRERAEDLLNFHYRVEIYVPPAKRQFGYYVMPILHEGALVGRLDPKLHRDRDELEIRALHLEKGVRRDESLDRGLAESLKSLAEFTGAKKIRLPRGWGKILK